MSVVSAANCEALAQKPEAMNYRAFGRTGLMVSALSMGCMRLGEDQEANTRVVARALELGVNYFETTRWYCGGQCQHRTAPGLAGKTRGVIVSGKCGIGPDSTAYGFRQEIERQLDILGLTHFKFFQVGWFSWGMMPHLLKRGGVLDALRVARDEGLVQFVGFTGHDTAENFIKCLETGLFDSMTVPYSLINRTYEGTIRRAGELGVGVVAMCPVAGGTLACESSVLKEALGLDLPTTEMALRFVLANPHVSTACSGMTSAGMVEQNACTVKAAGVAGSSEDHARMCAGLEKLRAAFGARLCTACRYCMPCPRGVDIPRHMELHRNWKAFGLADITRRQLDGVPADRAIELCNACGECEKKCPNQIPVRKALRELRRLRGKGAKTVAAPQA
ncbi:MAG: Aldo/keto reductase family protein [Lentisphaerae bacterium ADurb.BinA184]|nr:MAG: Aldo/keto reductase family protein [Lentisphaerae bacterium ADurb.BinA184]